MIIQKKLFVNVSVSSYGTEKLFNELLPVKHRDLCHHDSNGECMKNKEGVLIQAESTQGLCQRCKNLDNCQHRSKNDTALWYCEDFDDSIHRVLAKMTNSSSDSPTIEKFYFMGLCVNCKYRHNCEKAKKHGGVWQCKLYK